jgi:hypothetical protein
MNVGHASVPAVEYRVQILVHANRLVNQTAPKRAPNAGRDPASAAACVTTRVMSCSWSRIAVCAFSTGHGQG